MSTAAATMDYPQMGYAALPIRSYNGSQVAATAVAGAQEREPHNRQEAITEALQERDPTKLINKDFVLEMAEGGLPFMGAFGNVAGAAIGFLVADRRAQQQTESIIEQYREEIGEQLNMNPQNVDVRALLLAAQHNEGLRQAISHIEGEREAHPFANIAGLLGMGASVLFMPFLSFLGPMGWLGSMVLAGAGYMAGQYVGEKLLAPDQQLNPLIQMDALREKLASGEPVEATDIFGLRVTQNPQLRERILNQFGSDYYKLSGQDKHYAMNMVRGGHQLCARDAELVNAGGNMDDLMFGPMHELIQAPAQEQAPPQSRWVERVGGEPQRKTGSHAERVMASRAAPAGVQI